MLFKLKIYPPTRGIRGAWKMLAGNIFSTWGYMASYDLTFQTVVRQLEKLEFGRTWGIIKYLFHAFKIK